MTKAVILSALACVLLASASAASILARASVPAAGSASVAAIELPIANRDVKANKLEVALQQPDFSEADPVQEQAADAPTTTAAVEPTASAKPMQLAYATDELPITALPEAAQSEPISAAPKATTKLPPVIATAPIHKPKPKPAAKEALLSDGQIAKIKTRLNLSSLQEYYWPSVEQALRAIGRKLHTSPRDSGAPMIDPDSAEVQQLKYAAMPLLFQLREDQKQEVRKLARAMGLEQVAQQI
ncbi:hypothetical protein [Rhodopseudomonas parapalustris]